MTQEELLPLDRRVDRMDEKLFDKLLDRGFDPAYALRSIKPDDRVTVAERDLPRNMAKDPSGKVVAIEAIPRRRYAIVLSKGPNDRDRRIVAQTDGSTGWIVGLYVGLLRRQVKEGIRDVKAWAFETLLDLERMEGPGLVNRFTAENWIQQLVMKDSDPGHLGRFLRRRRKADAT